MSLPEIPETEATGRIAEIYRAILAATGLPSTNLVWRHMASRPGVLEWAYEALEPAFAAGTFRALGARLAAAVPPAPMAPLDGDDGLDRATLEKAAGVIAFYNRANPINLVALAALRRALAGERGGAGCDPAPTAPALPTLPAVAVEVDGKTRARMAAMARTINDADTAPMPTALRHLANWPATIAILHWRVEELAASGVLGEGAAAVRRSAEQSALRAPLAAPDSVRPGPETRHAIEGVIDLFDRPISRMVIVGHGFETVLREALAP